MDKQGDLEKIRKALETIGRTTDFEEGHYTADALLIRTCEVLAAGTPEREKVQEIIEAWLAVERRSA